MEVDTLSYAMLMPPIKAMLAQGKTVTLPLRGWSMRPFLEHERDKAVLAPVPPTLQRGDIILAHLGGERYALHRIVSIEGDSITMLGDGNLTPEHISRADVLAIATGFYRKGRQRITTLDTRAYRAYWRFWLAAFPVRRWLLIPWRIYNKLTSKTSRL